VRFEDQVRVIWRQRYWLLGSALLAAIVVFVVANLRDTSYTTSAVIGVTPGPVIAGNAVAVDTVSFTASRYQRLVGSDAVLTNGAAVADKGTTLQDMRERVTGSTTSGSGTVTVTVTGKGADETARVAAAVANATIAQGKADQEAQRNDSLTALRTERDTLRQQLDATATDAPERPQLESQYQSVVSDIATQQSAPFDAAQLLQTPEVPKGPTGPGPKSLALFAFLAVLILGGEAIVLWTRRRERLAKADAAAEEAAAVPEPVAASGIAPATVERVPLPVAPAPVPVAAKAPPTPAAPAVAMETLEQLPNTILEQIENGRRLFAVTGAAEVSGTNEVTLAVAQVLAAAGENTIVVEGDMTAPVLAKHFGIKAKVGLTDVLSGGTTLSKALRPLSKDGLALLPAGLPVGRPGPLLAAGNLRRSLTTSTAPVVLVSLPPSTPAAVRDEIARQLDAVVLVVADGHRREERAAIALQDLGALESRVVAVGRVDGVPAIELTYRPAKRSGASSPKAPPTAAELAAEGGTEPVADRPAVTAAAPEGLTAEAETTSFEPDTSVFAPEATAFAPESDAEPDETAYAPETTAFAPESDAEPDEAAYAPETTAFAPESDAEPDEAAYAPETTAFAPESDAEPDETAYAPEPVIDVERSDEIIDVQTSDESVTDEAVTDDTVTDDTVTGEPASEPEGPTNADEAYAPDDDATDDAPLDDYAAFAPKPDPAPEVESSANGHHDHVEDTPYVQSYDESLHQY
jgi:Mrp family chromosome partitioning ATPase